MYYIGLGMLSLYCAVIVCSCMESTVEWEIFRYAACHTNHSNTGSYEGEKIQSEQECSPVTVVYR